MADLANIAAATRADCDRRWAYLQEHGWKLTEEGILLDTSDSRWHKTDRILIEYVEGLPFEQGVRAAYMRQKMLEAQELAREQRRPRDQLPARDRV